MSLGIEAFVTASRQLERFKLAPMLAADARRMQGIYFLWDGGSLAYIGKASNICKRVREHFYAGTKVFDSVSVLHVASPDMLGAVERTYICALKAGYNKKSGRLTDEEQRAAQIIGEMWAESRELPEASDDCYDEIIEHARR